MDSFSLVSIIQDFISANYILNNHVTMKAATIYRTELCSSFGICSSQMSHIR